MGKFKDLTGKTFGNFTALEYLGQKVQPSGKRKSLWLCECVCGKTKELTSDTFTGSIVKSCGCIAPKSKVTHGKSKTPTYKIYKQMISRCYNTKDIGYPTYGGAGITVHPFWLESFENFLEDMGERPENTSLNRINGAKLYSKENCEWATFSVQAYDQKMRCTNKSGATGVRQIPSGKWVAEIDCKRRYYLGAYSTFEEAVGARKKAEIELFGWSKQNES